MQYASIKLLLDDKSFIAPLTNPQSILDVGTGTGNDGVPFALIFELTS